MKISLKNLKSQASSESSGGFVALFSVLLASVVLAMAVGIANISLKQVVLSGSATDANKSFYAADSGVECALYHDLRVNSFGQGLNGIDCAGIAIEVNYLQPSVATFEIPLSDGTSSTCASLSVDKIDPFGGVRIISKGTNTPCGENTERTVERVIEVTY